VPESFISCGLPPPLSVMLTSAARVPVCRWDEAHVDAAGRPAPKLLPHVLLAEKSPWSAPVTLMLVMLSVVEPTFVNVTICGLLTLWRERESAG